MSKLKLIHKEQVDSTSLEVKRLGGRCVVVADSQSQGMGRGSNTWDSPKGNLYLSAGFTGCKPDLSLQVAQMLCEVLWDLYFISPYVKWPNDLYFDGKKLGGILIETNSREETVVGIGLNVNNPPEDRISLSDLTGQKINLEALAQSIANRFTISGLNRTYDLDLSNQAFTPWQDDQGNWFFQDGLKEGALVLKDNCGIERVEYAAASLPRPIWLLENRPLYLADIGNSRSKFAYYKNGLENECEIFYDVADLPSPPVTPWPIFTSSVHQRVFEELKFKHEKEMTFTKLLKRPMSLESDYDISQLGIDRLMLLNGLKLPLRRNVVLCSLGTCFTMDIVTQERKHLGGYILPGIDMGIASMADGAENLSQVDLKEFSSAIPTNTADAMKFGVLSAYKAFIQKQVDTYQADLYLTGGRAELLGPGVDKLIFNGMRRYLNYTN